jgi:hypothetical protein
MLPLLVKVWAPLVSAAKVFAECGPAAKKTVKYSELYKQARAKDRQEKEDQRLLKELVENTDPNWATGGNFT